MPKGKASEPQGPGVWNFRGVDRDFMRRVKGAAALEGKRSVKAWLIELAEERLRELERKGILPKGK